jgi:hypothetical protein
VVRVLPWMTRPKAAGRTVRFTAACPACGWLTWWVAETDPLAEGSSGTRPDCACVGDGEAA